MGGGGSEAPQVPQEVQRLVDQLLQSGGAQFEQGLPLIESGGQDALEILRGNIPQSLRPAIQSATEQGRAAESAGAQQFFENLVRGGVTGSEFLGQTGAQQLAGEQRVADIPTAFTLPVFQETANQALGLPARGIQDINTALQILSGTSVPGRQRGGTAGALSGAAGGAVTGGTIGAIGGPIGIGAGALIGGGLGAFLGSR